MQLTDVLYEKRDGTAWITINRPERRNAFRSETVRDLLACVRDAWHDRDVGVLVLTGAGDKAFCSGGDQKESYVALDEVAALHTALRNVPKPVIAMVNGYAIGGGHVLHVVCDLSIAADTAVFGQTGPRVGSVDPGFGTAYLARVIGEKKAREIWYLCRQYGAAEALAMGLVNKVVAASELRKEVEAWCADLIAKSPTALRIAKQSFNADTDHIHGIGGLGFSAVELYYQSPEAKEGKHAFLEKRTPDFRKHAK
jgi:2-ketocyclohexanecarboxyl-CoA hydrolase